ncbi:MAG: glycosyl transferase family 9 [Actinobacteria bacterium]|jgi:ADP-heptose:LPS heptosyltransferase|nr:glycosyl transferase family 9 [Actinomycetota bacterium]
MRFQRFVDRRIGTLLCRALSLLPRRDGPPKRNGKPKNILVILLSEMGSLVLAAPMFRRISERFPHASVHVLLFERNREMLEILAVVPPGNILTIRDGSFADFAADSLGVWRRMRGIGVDVAIDCELFARASSILSFMSGAPVRAGFHPYTQEGLYRGSFINRPVLYNPYHHIARQLVDMVDTLDSDAEPANKLPERDIRFEYPKMEPEAGELDAMRERLYRDYPSLTGKELILMNPGGGILPIRAWPVEHYISVARELLALDYAVCVTGLPADRKLGEAIRAQCESPACVNLAGYTANVRELMVLFHMSRLLIANDGGPGQFSAMTPIPAIVLYGPETPALYGVHNDKTVNLFSSLSCSPCLTAYNHRNSPCDGDNLCMKSISPRTVVDHALELLRGKG